MEQLPANTAQRLTRCYYFACELKKRGIDYFTSSEVASLLEVDETQIRKDMARIRLEGIPKKGYPVQKLVARLEQVFGFRKERRAIIIGVGNLGRALLNYPGFYRYGVQIVCGVEKDPNKCFQKIAGIKIYPVEKMEELIAQMEISIAILAIPPSDAQIMADRLSTSGIEGIWNFSPALIKVPKEIALRNECLESGLALLLHQIGKKNTTFSLVEENE
ncbi:MAG: redox-sensing transcriptional repressor [Candidatus Atribacteria bacterium]|nr:redox-sensing transcriptional repressor [Candidatus Atribacteria bacterium]